MRRPLCLLLLMTACSSDDRPANQDRETGDVEPPDAGARIDGSNRADARASSCPAARPAEETACTATGSCSYDEIECRCEAGKWSCEEPVNPDCPQRAPADGSACTLPDATECDFLQQECECLAGVWSCQSEEEEDAGPSDAGRITRVDGGLDAGGSCPEARPAERAVCTASSDTCTYESTECVCPTGRWSCSEPVEMGCPATTPLHGDPCSGIADCDFLEVECECLSGAWSCKAND